MGLFGGKKSGKSGRLQEDANVQQGIFEKNGHPYVMGFPGIRLLRTPERQGVRVRVNTLSQGAAEFTVNKNCVTYSGGINGKERYDVLLVDPEYTLYTNTTDQKTGKQIREFAGKFSPDDIAQMMESASEQFNMRCKNPATIIPPPGAISKTYLKSTPLAPGQIDREEVEKMRQFSEALKINPNAIEPDF